MSTWLLLMAMLAALLHAPTVHAQNANLPTAWPNEVKAALQEAGIPLEAASFWVAPADQGEPVFAHLPQQMRPIASVMKVFTTGAALHKLGADWTWSTHIGLDGSLNTDGRLKGNVHIRGSGDPKLLIEHLTTMLSQWRDGGLQHIDGDVVIDRSAFQIPAHNPWDFDQNGWRPYNAGPDPFLLNNQTVMLNLSAASSEEIDVEMVPKLSGVSVISHLRLEPQRACDDWRSGISLELTTTPEATLRLSGTYPANCGPQNWPILWPEQERFTARLMRQIWEDLGGTLSGDVRSGPWPKTLSVWQAWRSETLSQVVRDINKFSNNVMARQLFLTLSDPQPATLSASRRALGTTVTELTRPSSGIGPCHGEQLQIENGAGLSRVEFSTANCIGSWLQAMWRSPVRAPFLDSLPITGIDGTTKRWQNTEGLGHIKTGSLAGVYAMAGYVMNQNREPYVLVGLIQHPQASSARHAFETLVNWAHQLPQP